MNRRIKMVLIVAAAFLSIPAIIFAGRGFLEPPDPYWPDGAVAQGGAVASPLLPIVDQTWWECTEPVACLEILDLLLEEQNLQGALISVISRFRNFQEILFSSIEAYEAGELEYWELGIGLNIAPSGSLAIYHIGISNSLEMNAQISELDGVPPELEASLVQHLEREVSVQYAIWLALEEYEAARLQLMASSSEAAVLQRMNLDAARYAQSEELDAKYPRARRRMRQEEDQRLLAALGAISLSAQEDDARPRIGVADVLSIRLVVFVLAMVGLLGGLLLALFELLNRDKRSERLWQVSLVIVPASISILYGLIIPS